MTELLTELSPSLQKLVDARLDNIDRALLSTDITRYERRQIVSAVEDQILELVARIDRAEPTRDDILRILASLDPPEAYGSGSMAPAMEQTWRQEPKQIADTRSVPILESKANTLAVVSVVLGAASLVVLPSVFVIDFLALLLSAVVAMAASTCGVVALCQVLNAKGKSYGKGMAILGIVSLPVALMSMSVLYIVLSGF